VKLVKDYSIQLEKDMILMMAVINNLGYPYQNAKLRIEIDDRLSIIGVEPFSWHPKDNGIDVGDLPTSLSDATEETEIVVKLKTLEDAKEYLIGGTLSFGNCEYRKNRTVELEQVSIGP